MRRYFCVYLSCVISVCVPIMVDAKGQDQSPRDPPAPPGTILSETTRDLGNGYREVHRSEVNPPGGFEGIGHFGFMYFQDQKLCQCGSREIAISPGGEFAVYAQSGGSLVLFDSRTGSTKTLSKGYIGKPTAAVWLLSDNRVSLTLEKYVNDQPTISKLDVAL